VAGASRTGQTEQRANSTLSERSELELQEAD
jgi:hypothetical protein